MPKPRAWISGAASLALAVSWHAPLNAAITLHGIVLDRGTKVPVSNAIVTCVGDRAKHQDITDTYGLFTLELRDEVQAAQEITFRIEKEGDEASTQKESANGIVQIKLFITPTKRADSPAARPSTPRPNAAVHRSVPAPPPKARTPMLPDAPPEVLNFIQELRSEDPSARENAAIALGKMGGTSLAAVPDLIQALKDKMPAVQIRAASALEQIRPKSRQAVVGLVIALNDSRNPGLRLAAVQALGALGPAAQEAVPQVMIALNDDNKNIRLAAAKAALVIDGLNRPEIAKALCPLLLDGDPTPALAAAILKQVGPAIESCQRELATLLNISDKWQLAYSLLTSAGSAGQAIIHSRLTSGLASEDEVRQIVRTFPEMRPAAGETLSAKLKRCEYISDCTATANVLSEIDPDRIDDVVRELLRHYNGDEYGQIQDWLKKIGPRAAPAIERLLVATSGPKLLSWGKLLLTVDPGASSRIAAILDKVLESGSAEDKVFASVVLVRAGVSTERSGDVVVNGLRLKRKSPFQREYTARDAAISVLDRISLPSGGTGPVIALLFDNKESTEDRQMAVSALAKEGTRSEEAIRQLLRCLQFCEGSSFNQDLQSTIYQALYQLGATALPVINEALNSSDTETQKVAAKLVGMLTCDRSALVNNLAKGLGDRRIIKEYADAIAKIGPSASAAVPNLVQVVQSGGDTAKYALTALGALGRAASPAVPALIQAMHNDKRNRYEIVKALGDIGAAARSALPELQRYAASSEGYGVPGAAREAFLKIQAAIAQ